MWRSPASPWAVVGWVAARGAVFIAAWLGLGLQPHLTFIDELPRLASASSAPRGVRAAGVVYSGDDSSPDDDWPADRQDADAGRLP